MTFLLVYIIDLRFSVIGWATKSCPAKISLDENNTDKSLSGNNLKKISFPRKFVGTAATPPRTQNSQGSYPNQRYEIIHDAHT